MRRPFASMLFFCVALGAATTACSVLPLDDETGAGGALMDSPSANVSVGSAHSLDQPYACAEPQTFHASILRDGAVVRSDEMGPDGPLGDSTWSVSGVITQLGGGVFELDACGVTPCTPEEVYEISAGATGDDACVHDGSFVKVTYETRAAAADVPASYALMMENLESLDGFLNPYSAPQGIWFEGMHGIVSGTPFTPSLSLGSTCYFVDGRTAEGHDLVLAEAELNGATFPIQLGTPAVNDTFVGRTPVQSVFTDLSSVIDGGTRAIDFSAACILTPT